MGLNRLTEDMLIRVAQLMPDRADAAFDELGRREHEDCRRRLLDRLHTCPIPAGEIREGDVLSEHCGAMRLYVRSVHTLPRSGRVLITGSFLRLDNGTPSDENVELPLMDADNTSLNLVTHHVTDLQPYISDLVAA